MCPSLHVRLDYVRAREVSAIEYPPELSPPPRHQGTAAPGWQPFPGYLHRSARYAGARSCPWGHRTIRVTALTSWVLPLRVNADSVYSLKHEDASPFSGMLSAISHQQSALPFSHACRMT